MGSLSHPPRRILSPMLPRFSPSILFAIALCASLAACSARSSLPQGEGGGASTGGAGGAGGGCVDGDFRVCGSNIPPCRQGKSTCVAGVFGPCEGDIGPGVEVCNGVDDNCDGQIDEGFGVGQACDGADTDLCLDDIMSCGGCSKGDDNIETCNGVDDNCNGIIDADCVVGDCKPTLDVVGSTPSSPSCIDFPVQAGSVGGIEFPCGGGPVTAQLGDISFTGSVTNDVVSLVGTAEVVGPDHCTWQTTHHIDGVLSQGSLTYSYEEWVTHSGLNLCWSPCTETGQVTIKWGTTM